MTDKEYFDKLWDRSKGRLLIAALLLCLIVSIVFNVHQCSRPQYEPAKSDTTTTVEIKNHVDTMPKELKPERVVGHVTVPFIPSFSMSGENKPAETTLFGRNGENKTDSTCLFEQNCENKHETADSITLDVVQRTYGDSTYTAYVSGPKFGSVGPQLDSINVRQMYVTREITNTVVERKHWHFGIGTGAGLGVTSRKFDIWVGAVAMYEF